MFHGLARRKNWAILTVGFLTLGIRAAIIPAVGIPAPTYHDEFSYLLGADTFAHGRLTNPTHPMWIHFETFHVIQQPTYSSIYPPAQGVVLAAGELLGNPWIGQWLITGLMCSAICWMLQGWLPPTWALYGAMLVMLRIGVLRYWMNGYWSASLVALGGALILGALPRIKKHPRMRYAVLMAAGLVILANSRPYEGFVLGATVVLSLLVWMVRARTLFSKAVLTHAIAPLAVILVVAAIATGYYYDRVTGSPFRMTYNINAHTYNFVPFFLWQKALPEPGYHHETLRQFYEQEFAEFTQYQTLVGLLRHWGNHIATWWSFYLGAALTIPLLALPWAFRDRRMRFAWIASGIFLTALLCENWGLSHYAAPATGLLFLIVVQCARHIALWTWKGKAIGRLVVIAIPLLLFGTLVLRVTTAIAQPSVAKTWPRGNVDRVSIARQLAELPGKHLILVRYAPGHDIKMDWVYNGADIDGSKIVWARDMGEAENQDLLRYFHDRQVWTIVVNDVSTPMLSRYPSAQTTTR